MNTVEPTAELSKQGRGAEVGVLLACDKDQKAKLRVSVSQRSGAFVQRKRKVSCTTPDGVSQSKPSCAAGSGSKRVRPRPACWH